MRMVGPRVGGFHTYATACPGSCSRRAYPNRPEYPRRCRRQLQARQLRAEPVFTGGVSRPYVPDPGASVHGAPATWVIDHPTADLYLVAGHRPGPTVPLGGARNKCQAFHPQPWKVEASLSCPFMPTRDAGHGLRSPSGRNERED